MNLDIKTHSWRRQAHHRDGGGFCNVQQASRTGSALEVAQWMVHHFFEEKENVPPPVRGVSLAALHARPERLRVTWMGHSTTLIQTPSANLLTDPIFSRRASPVPFAGPARLVPPPLAISALPPIDVVLCSHDHYDHLDRASAKEIRRRFRPTFFAPLGVKKRLDRWGVGPAIEMDWGQYVDLNGMRLHCAPARHFSGRSLFDRNATLWASWYVEEPAAGGLRFYYAGDSAYAEHFGAVRKNLGAPEVALLPIGAYRPRWFMQPVHMDPAQAVQAFLDLEARHFVPVHWGTFDLAEEPAGEAPRLAHRHAAAHSVAQHLHVLDVGQSFDLTTADAALPAPGTPASAV